MITQCFYYT